MRAGSRSMLWLALEALDTGEVHRPGEGRATPALPCRTQFGASVEGTHAQAIGRWVCVRGGRIDRCPAFGAEPMRSLVPAFSGLDVDLRYSARQNEGAVQARKSSGLATRLARSCRNDRETSGILQCVGSGILCRPPGIAVRVGACLG